jgi:uncharacterized protein YndB with AHSA1/START domain
MDSSNTDRIEKTVLLNAPQSRVWQAIADSEKFGEWFGVKFDGQFAAGAAIRGRISFKGNEHLMEMWVERIEPESYFSYRWHPYAIDAGIDYSAEPTTLVEFRLKEAKGGTELTIIETGFDSIPKTRRAEAFRMNSQGWTFQAQSIERYVTKE